MLSIPLQAVPNQRLQVRLDVALFELEIKTARRSMCISVKRDGRTLVQGARCLAGAPLIPHRYLASAVAATRLTDEDSNGSHRALSGETAVAIRKPAARANDYREAAAAGNFYFMNRDGAYPHYSRFGGEDALYYMPRAELEALRNG
jgi:hypothetical protein